VWTSEDETTLNFTTLPDKDESSLLPQSSNDLPLENLPKGLSSPGTSSVLDLSSIVDIEDDRYDSLSNDDNFECSTSGDETPQCIEPNVADSQCTESYKNDLLLLALKLRHRFCLRQQ